MTTARAAVDAAMSERDFAQAVVDLANLCGWLVYRTWSSLHSPAGYPDLTLVRERILFRELKSGGGRLNTAQREWGERLLAAGADYAVWRPSDWGQVEDALRRAVR